MCTYSAVRGDKPAPTLADAKGIRFETFKPVDPSLPPVPGHYAAGQYTTFEVK